MSGARRAEVTSDLRRARGLATGAAASAIAVVAAVLAAGEQGGSPPRPVARPHALAKVQCADCHGQGRAADTANASCTRCHGRHASTRAAHQALAERGALPCTTCHEAHAQAAGISFDAAGKGSLWVGDSLASVAGSGPRGATVPLVPVAACRTCHSDGPRDPARACVAADGAGFSTCFDEHRLPTDPPSRSGAGPSRFVAWEAARRALDEGSVTLRTRGGNAPEQRAEPALAAGSARTMSASAGKSGHALPPWLLVALGMSAGGLAFAGATSLRGGRARSPVTAPPTAPARVRLPVIDATRCLGCHACVDVCPFDVLAVGQYVAKVVRPDACCGVGACETACPNGSLRLAADGDPLPDRPRVDDHLESLDSPGVYVAGDLTGVPLIRNAILQGSSVARRVAETLPSPGRSRDPAACLDLAIVGAGPAGLSAALRARGLGLSCAVFEQSTIAATVRAFPRGKLVHDPPLEFPLEGALWLRESTKEELIAQWTRLVRAHRLDVREHHRALGITRAKGGFELRLERPDGPIVVRATRVLLAVGRRGTPRPLVAEVSSGAACPVVSSLSDARALAGKRVLVVGLGDSAMEAIVAVARQPGSDVVVSYRGEAFGRGRARNIEQVRRLEAAGRVRIVFRSVVSRVDAEGVLLETPDGGVQVGADIVLALLGGDAPRALLEASGVRLETAPTAPGVIEWRSETEC
jgi:thioredoxin reductase/NAD-dependent dihydropyrimidine dehydrogenase PreA subunit